MGVSGSGKTTVGKLLSSRTGWPFYDGDDFHSAANIEKMKSGQALTDEDRQPWLERLNAIAREEMRDKGCIIACSALKNAYRNILSAGLSGKVYFCWLKGEAGTIQARMAKRNHFMPVSLLESQLEILEPPVNGLELNIDQSPAKLVNTIIKHMNEAEFGVAGLGVMGKSIARNFARRGYKLALYNRHVKGTEEKVAKKAIDQFCELSACIGFDDAASFVKALSRPRKLLLMVEAGSAVDDILGSLLPHLQKGDVVIDGGNSHYKDTERRMESCSKKGVHFMGCGISGGEKGALDGPAIMPGGNHNAYQLVKPYLETVAATNFEGRPCCTYISEGGSGHYVKMVHNGIEYAEMQLIAEVYGILRYGLNLHPDEIAETFHKWNKKKNASYLLEISSTILSTKVDGDWIIDKIHDSAGSKGTGGWTALESIERGQAFTTMVAALFSRYLSADWKWRKTFSEKVQKKHKHKLSISIKQLEDAYYLSRLINHHLGFELIKKAAIENKWDIDYSQLAAVWTNGCIIRSSLMTKLTAILANHTQILEDETLQEKMHKYKKSLVASVCAGLQTGIDVSAMSAAANYINIISTYPGTASLIQAQRDFFGAHTFKWADQPDGKPVHFHWE